MFLFKNPFEVSKTPFEKFFSAGELDHIQKVILQRVSSIYKEIPNIPTIEIANLVFNLYFKSKKDFNLVKYLEKFPAPIDWEVEEIFCCLRDLCFNIAEHKKRIDSGLTYYYRWMSSGRGCYYKHHSIHKEKGGLNGFIFSPKKPPFDFLANKNVWPGELLKCDCLVYPILDFEKPQIDSPSILKKEIVDFKQKIFLE